LGETSAKPHLELQSTTIRWVSRPKCSSDFRKLYKWIGELLLFRVGKPINNTSSLRLKQVPKWHSIRIIGFFLHESLRILLQASIQAFFDLKQAKFFESMAVQNLYFPLDSIP
jgi:hypothetical protein